MKERRRFRRFSVALDAKYMKVNGYTTISSLVTTKNISLGGICAGLSKLVRKGDELMIELVSFQSRSLAALAKVKWVRPVEETGDRLFGLQFLWVSSKPVLGDYVSFAKDISTVS
ncbi:MAG: PilZ domain-containing protein [Candidatus Omnitrophota bacterium]